MMLLLLKIWLILAWISGKTIQYPGIPPFQPTIAKYTDDYIILISSSKIFSYAGQRIGMMAISDHLFEREYPDLAQILFF